MNTDRSQSSFGAAPRGSAISQGLSLLGTASGIGVAILLTPLLFGLTKQPLFSYLSESWGPALASMLTWVMGGVEGVVIYVVTKLLISIAATSAIVALAARRIPLA